jgi:hypothetical protein
MYSMRLVKNGSIWAREVKPRIRLQVDLVGLSCHFLLDLLSVWLSQTLYVHFIFFFSFSNSTFHAFFGFLVFTSYNINHHHHILMDLIGLSARYIYMNSFWFFFFFFFFSMHGDPKNPNPTDLAYSNSKKINILINYLHPFVPPWHRLQSICFHLKFCKS